MFIKRSTAFILVHKQALVFKFSVNEDIKENNKCQFLSRQDFKPSPKDLYSTCQQSAANVQKICKNNNYYLASTFNDKRNRLSTIVNKPLANFL